MNKKVLLMAIASALCCRMGISRADEVIPDAEAAAHRAITAMAVAEKLGTVQIGQPTGEELTVQIPSLYRNSITDMNFTDKKIGTFLYSYYASDRASGIRSPGTVLYAVQATSYAAEFGVNMSLVQYAQNQQLIDQNSKIINLLTQLVAKK